MRTDRLWVKVTLATLVVLMCAWVAFGQEGPTAEELAQVTATLITAQGKIARGDLETGQTALTAIQEVAQANLASRWEFVTKLSDAVTAEKSDKLADAAVLVGTLIPAAVEADQLAAAFAVTTRLVDALNRTDNGSKAAELVTSLSQGPVTQSGNLGLHLDLARLWTAVRDRAAARGTLRSAAALVETESDRTRWVAETWTLIRTGSTTQTMTETYDGLAPAVNSTGTKEVFVQRFLDWAATRLASNWDEKATPDGTAIITVFSPRAAGFPALAEKLKVTGKVLTVRQRMDADDHTGAFQGIQEGCTLAGEDSAALALFHRQGSHLLYMMIKAGERISAENLVVFLGRKDLRQASYPNKVDRQWEVWARNVHATLRLDTFAKDVLATYERVSVIADCDAARETLLREFLDEACRRITASNHEKPLAEAIILFKSLRERASALPGLADQIAFTELMVSVRNYAQQGKTVETLDTLEEALEKAAVTPNGLRHLSTMSGLLLTQSARAKETVLAEQLLIFLAREEMRTATGSRSPLDQWKRWTGKVRTVAGAHDLADDLLLLHRELTELVWSEPKALVSQAFLNRARQLMGLDYRPQSFAEGVALFEGLKASVTVTPELAEEFLLTQHMASAFTLGQAKDYAGAISSLQKAYGIAKGNPTEVDRVYREAKYLLKTVPKEDAVSAEALKNFIDGGPGAEWQATQVQRRIDSLLKKSEVMATRAGYLEDLAAKAQAEGKQALSDHYLKRARPYRAKQTKLVEESQSLDAGDN